MTCIEHQQYQAKRQWQHSYRKLYISEGRKKNIVVKLLCCGTRNHIGFFIFAYFCCFIHVNNKYSDFRFACAYFSRSNVEQVMSFGLVRFVLYFIFSFIFLLFRMRWHRNKWKILWLLCVSWTATLMTAQANKTPKMIWHEFLARESSKHFLTWDNKMNRK